MSSSPDNALKRLTSYQNLSSDNSNLRNKIEELKKQLELAQNERQKLENENAKRKSIALQLSGKIRRWEELLKEKELVYEDEKRALEIASLEFESAKRDFDYFQANIKSQREQFLERSRVFREKCKQLRLEASMNGMEYACVQAWTNLHGVGCPSHFDSLDAIAHDDDDIDADPSAWKAIDDNDDEMKEAMAMFLKEKRKFEEAKQEFDEAEENKERLVDRAEDGQHRKEQLVKQLQRIQKDNADLEEQIAQAARLGEEAKQKRLSQLRGGQPTSVFVTPSNPPTGNFSLSQPAVNPYAKKAQSNDNRKRKSQSNPADLPFSRREQVMAAVLGPRASSSAEQQQHPHRDAGRFRRDRQFGSDIYVAGGEPLAAPETVTPHMSNSTQEHRSLSTFYEDSDDDDDPVLHYQAFKKKGSSSEPSLEEGK